MDPERVAWRIPLLTLGLMIMTRQKQLGVKGICREKDRVVDDVFDIVERITAEVLAEGAA